MLDSELDDREPDNNGPADAGRSDAVGGTGPAPEASGAGDPDGAEDEAGGQGRRLFRRGRRAVTRPAGPPQDDPATPGHEGDTAGAVPYASAPTVADSGPAPGPEFTASPPWSHQETQAAEAPPAAFQPPLVIFQPPDIATSGARRPAGASAQEADETPGGGEQDEDGDAATGGSKRRRRGGRGKGRGGGDEAAEGAEAAAGDGDDTATSGTAKSGTAKSGTEIGRAHV